ncbi:glycerophosphodiester phosphodiesterase GDPD1, chloroplastic-like isoform X1 [Zingiber officinale]|uniref:glycerophosphodiester phosphodiesterase GDPD1, chloroplastic-like isoform X1 n=1 Tax=Zingiber officinale TaxID=94328 RepID=UPI001C4D2E58|nr:glycerophosphodiester phosphodiesterase GDPD1, chloroplastic-like isoform X1 [Zingiber officinale]
MALKAAHVSDVPTIDQIPDVPAVALSTVSALRKGTQWKRKSERLVVVGHRGKGMNALASTDPRLQEVKENSLRSFNDAARFPVDFVEFDVQVTKDDCPVIFHDDLILTEEDGKLSEKHVTSLTLDEFLSYGPPKDPLKKGKPLLRKTKDGRILNWKVLADAPFCTLQEAFQGVDPQVGFNVELKFNDNVDYKDEELIHALETILKVVNDYANERPIIFSSFQPDAAKLIRKLQNDYPVFFLSNGGTEIYRDPRRNSLDEAIKLCLENGLQAIVSEVKAIFRNPSAVAKIKEANLVLFTYGQLNNVPEAVYMQHIMGVSGVIVDLVQEITEAVSAFSRPDVEGASRPKFSQAELSFLLRLIPELVQH